jgi:hypothetical protein
MMRARTRLGAGTAGESVRSMTSTGACDGLIF